MSQGLTILGDVGAGNVLGRYELLMPIASGGMAAVWAARLKGSRGFQKIVAIKTILPQLVEDPQFDQMFLDEASLVSRIRHPNIVEILDLGEQDGVLYLVMEWVDGEPASVLVKAASKTGGIPIPVAVRIVCQACAGLHAAHELRDESGVPLGLVHRDVSPQNLLITFDGVVKVVDFGVAKATGRASVTTSAGQVKGKAAYMAPEQARGQDIDRRSDVFALGIVLYVLTTGHHPFRAENDVATVYNICSPDPAPPPTQFVPGYPRALETVLLRALAKDPARRYPTANDLLRALNHALPEDERIVTDDVVAEFMTRLFAGRHEHRRESLKMALRIADERAAQRAKLLTIPPCDSISSSGVVPREGPSARRFPSDRPTMPGASLGLPTASGSVSGTSTSATPGAIASVAEEIDAATFRPRPGRGLRAIAAMALVGFAVWAFVRFRGQQANTASSTPLHATAGEPGIASTVSLPAPPPVEAPAARKADGLTATALDAVPADAGYAVTAGRAKASFRTTGGRSAPARTPAPTSLSPAPTTASPHSQSSDTTFLSPVRTPGF